MSKYIKYVLIGMVSIVIILIVSITIYIYANTVKRDSFECESHHITFFTENAGNFIVYIIPRKKYLLVFLDLYDYIEMIESDEKYVAILEDSMKIYIPPNKVFINQNGKKYEIKENTVTKLENFSGFDDVNIYFGDEKVKEQFFNDSKEYCIKQHS